MSGKNRLYVSTGTLVKSSGYNVDIQGICSVHLARSEEESVGRLLADFMPKYPNHVLQGKVSVNDITDVAEQALLQINQEPATTDVG